jgi:16S rRNA C967 or C1407 C5-methylase (RsmB/RsmF family)
MSLRRTNPVYENILSEDDEEHLKELVASVLRDLDRIKGIIQDNQQIEESVKEQISQAVPDSFVVRENIVEEIMKLAERFPNRQRGGKKRKTLKGKKGKTRGKSRHNKSKLRSRKH